MLLSGSCGKRTRTQIADAEVGRAWGTCFGQWHDWFSQYNNVPVEEESFPYGSKTCRFGGRYEGRRPSMRQDSSAGQESLVGFFLTPTVSYRGPKKCSEPVETRNFRAVLTPHGTARKAGWGSYLSLYDIYNGVPAFRDGADYPRPTCTRGIQVVASSNSTQCQFSIAENLRSRLLWCGLASATECKKEKKCLASALINDKRSSLGHHRARRCQFLTHCGWQSTF